MNFKIIRINQFVIIVRKYKVFIEGEEFFSNFLDLVVLFLFIDFFENRKKVFLENKKQGNREGRVIYYLFKIRNVLSFLYNWYDMIKEDYEYLGFSQFLKDIVYCKKI